MRHPFGGGFRELALVVAITVDGRISQVLLQRPVGRLARLPLRHRGVGNGAQDGTVRPAGLCSLLMPPESHIKHHRHRAVAHAWLLLYCYELLHPLLRKGWSFTGALARPCLGAVPGRFL